MTERIQVVSIGYNNRLSFREYVIVDMTEFKNTLGALKDITKGTQLVPGDRVLFSKFSKVPRYKFAEYAKNHNMTRVISQDKATAMVVDIDPIKKRAKDSLNKMYVVKFHKSLLGVHSNHSLPDYLYLQDGYQHRLEQVVPGVKSKLGQVETVCYSYYVEEFENAVKDLERVVKLSGTARIILDQSVLGQINDGVEVDKDVYEQLRQMFLSGNKDNVSLAMELMANSDYAKSEIKVALLLNEFWQTSMYQNNYRNLVNFKSMLKYFEKYKWGAGPVEFAETIIRTTTDEMEDKEERLELARKQVLNWINQRIPGTIFSVDQITIKT